MESTSLIAANEYEVQWLNYHYNPGTQKFHHNIDRDLHCFVAWTEAKPMVPEIREELSSRFKIVCDLEFAWSREHLAENTYRLYELPIRLDGKDFYKDERLKKTGDGNFHFFAVEDKDPAYVYDQSVSGNLELVNPKVVEVKRLFRKRLGLNRVHSSNNIEEFYTQAALILGPEMLTELLNGKEIIESEILHKDLEGCGGWKNLRQLFTLLNIGADYLVLRNFESLPDNPEDDIDFLTRDYQKLASLANLKQKVKENRPYKGVLQVGDQELPVDIRFIGDGYYDAVWEKEMLERKIRSESFYIPRADDHFFSLIYHARIHKVKVREDYYSRLESLAQQIGYEQFEKHILDSDEQTGKLLGGYMTANGYRYESPIDPGVKENKPVIAYLPGKMDISRKEKVKVFKSVKIVIKKLLPQGVVEYFRKRS